MRTFQPLIYVLILPIFYLTCRHFLRRLTSAVLATIGLLTALSTYSAYLMPETVYMFLFFLLVLAVIKFATHPFMLAFASGVLVATLTLTKPHGIAIAAAVALTLSICVLSPQLAKWSRARTALALLLYAATFYGSLIALNATLTGHLRFHPLLFVGDGYANFFVSKQTIAPVRDLLIVGLGNAIGLAVLIGFPSRTLRSSFSPATG